jgi:hypothetical protein
VGGGQCNKDTSSPNSLESVIVPGSHNKIKVTQNIFINNFCFYCFLVFLIFTEIDTVCNLFWIIPMEHQREKIRENMNMVSICSVEYTFSIAGHYRNNP